MKVSYHVCKHWDPDKRASWFCAFEPKKHGLQFVATGKRSPEGGVYTWWVWNGPIMIGALELLTNGKWRPCIASAGLKGSLKHEFDTLIEGGKWLNKFSRWGKDNRRHYALGKTQDRRERQVEQAQRHARRKVEKLARKLGVQIQPLTED